MGKYQIMVGRKREASNALAGFLDKKDNSIIRGEAKPVTIRVGVYGIPNGTHFWGVRLNKQGEVPNDPLSVEDINYTGKIKPLKWGTEGGTMIRGRWLAAYPTIDKDYQDLRLKVNADDGFMNGEGISMITLQHGENQFDEVKDAPLIMMLTVTHYNRDSIFCDPDAEGGEVFHQVKQTDIDKDKTRDIDDKISCILLVNEASNNPSSIKNLFDIVKGIELSDVNPDDASDIYKNLKYFADGNPEVFASRINKFKANVSDVFERAKSYEILDLTKDGVVVAENKKKKEIIFENIPAKGEGMLDYAFAHYLEPEMYEGINKLQKITDKLK